MSSLYEMTPKEIVGELDKYIIGQERAKKSVAVALRNRYRRSRLDEKLQEEITPKNILMMGPTGCGKTEIARRLAKLMDAPFVKVEATKFTEVGYVGRDVDSMVRDLAETSVRLTKQKKMESNYAAAEGMVEDILVNALAKGQGDETNSTQPMGPAMNGMNIFDSMMNFGNINSQKQQYEENMAKDSTHENKDEKEENDLTKNQIRQMLKDGMLEEEYVEIKVVAQPKSSQLDMGDEGMSIAIGNIFDNMMPSQKKTRKMKVKDARKVILEEEAGKLIDMDQVVEEALRNAEQNGIIFIDEIDKIASGNAYRGGADVSREGVQRDILPIVEGSVIKTKHGPVKTDHILFIGAGAFHTAKPTDLIPELQGRFPIRVELENLTEEALLKILTVPENALIKQQKALLETEGVSVNFQNEAVKEIARVAHLMNEETENIGARRLHTILERLLEDISYNLPGEGMEDIVIDKEYVMEKFQEKIQPTNLDKYIL